MHLASSLYVGLSANATYPQSFPLVTLAKVPPVTFDPIALYALYHLSWCEIMCILSFSVSHPYYTGRSRKAGT